MDFKPVHLTVTSHPECLKQIRSLMTDVSGSLKLGQKETADIILAVDEACSNIMRHGYHNDTSRQIHLTIRREKDELIIQVVDDGECFDISEAKARNPEDVHPGGLGIYIIKQVMDRVEYDKTDTGHNKTRLIKKL